jgi:hypothetical protein
MGLQLTPLLAKHPPEISAGPTFNPDWKAFMLGGINFPTPGCWEITARFEDAEGQFVVWVVPATAEPPHRIMSSDSGELLLCGRRVDGW